MEYRQKEKLSLQSLHPYRKPKTVKLLKIPLAYGRAGIENLIKLLSEEISEPALVNTLSLIRDEMKCQETKSRSIELNLVRVLGRGLRRDWMISEYLSDEEAKHLIQARSLTLDILGDVSTISLGFENGPDSFGMKLKRKLAVYPGMAGRVLDHVKLFNNSK